MPKSATWPPVSRGERPLPEDVRTFLIESQRRVLSHCLTLLAQNTLSSDGRERLLRVAATAEEEMQHLVGRHEINAIKELQGGP